MLAHIAYNESYPMDTLSDADLAERLNMGTFVGTREDRTGWTATEFENPANYDDSFPVRPSRHYSGEPRIFDASVEAVLLAKSDVSMTLRIHVIIDGFFVSNPPPPTDAGYWFTPTAASFGGTNYSSVLINSKSWPLQSRDFPADTSLIRGIAGVSNGGKGLHFNFGVYFPSTILRTSLSHQFETEVGLLSNPDDVITIPLSGHVPSNPIEVVAGEHVEVTATRVQPENFSNRYVVQYHVVQSHDRLPFDLADQTVEIKPFNGLPFVN